MSGSVLFRYTPGIGRVPVVLAGPTGPQGIPGTAVNTGATGPTGGVTSVPSAFSTSSVSAVLATGPTGTQLSATTITTTQTGYVWATTSVELKNLDQSSAHDVTLYQIVNGHTSDGLTISLAKKSNSGTYQVATASARTPTPIGPGTWAIETYAYTADTTTDVTAVHRDTFAVGHLS